MRAQVMYVNRPRGSKKHGVSGRSQDASEVDKLIVVVPVSFWNFIPIFDCTAGNGVSLRACEVSNAFTAFHDSTPLRPRIKRPQSRRTESRMRILSRFLNVFPSILLYLFISFPVSGAVSLLVLPLTHAPTPTISNVAPAVSNNDGTAV